MAIGHGSKNLDEFRLHVKDQYQLISDLAAGSGSEWMVLEAWMSFGTILFNENVDGDSLDDLQDDYYEVLTEEYLEIEENKPVGFFFWSWIMKGANVKDRAAEDVLKEFFSEF